MPPTRVCRYIAFLRLATFIQRRFRPRKKKKWTRRSPRRDRLDYRDRIIVGCVDFTATLILENGWKINRYEGHNRIVWKVRCIYPSRFLSSVLSIRSISLDLCNYLLRLMLFSSLLVQIYLFLYQSSNLRGNFLFVLLMKYLSYSW